MRWKMFIPIAALTLMMTTVAPSSKVEAFLEYGLILAVVGVGPQQGVEFYVVREVVPPGNATSPGGVQGDTATFMITVTNAGPSGAHGNEGCQQTILAPVAMTVGLNTVNISKDGALLLINGEEVPLEGDCLINATRVALTLGVPRPPIKDGQVPVDPSEDRVGLANLARFLGYSIYNLLTGETNAAGIREVVPDGFIQTFPVPIF